MLVFYFVFLNLFTFFLFAEDKKRARKEMWRIPERTLLLFALFGGSVGALAGMYLCRHKTRKWKFRIGVPVMLAGQIMLGAVVQLSLIHIWDFWKRNYSGIRLRLIWSVGIHRIRCRSMWCGIQRKRLRL